MGCETYCGPFSPVFDNFSMIVYISEVVFLAVSRI